MNTLEEVEKIASLLGEMTVKLERFSYGDPQMGVLRADVEEAHEAAYNLLSQLYVGKHSCTLGSYADPLANLNL